MDYSQFAAPVLSRIASSIRIHMAMNLATTVSDNPLAAKGILQYLINEKALGTHTIRDELSGEDIVFIGKEKSEYKVHRSLPTWEPDAVLSPYQCKVLNILQAAKYSINMKVYDFVQENRAHWQWKMGTVEMDKIRYTMRAAQEHLALFPDGEFIQKTATKDGRRYYQLMNPITHQGGDVPRGLTQWAKARKIRSEAAKSKFIACITDEYGVDINNYKLVVANPKLAFTNEYGLKGKKPACTYAAALAVDDIIRTGRTKYILQQDQTCSGFQHWAMELGCMNLQLLTNIKGGPRQDLYTTAYGLAEMHIIGDYAYFFNRQTGKFFVMRIGYGAAAKSLARGLILDKPQDDDFEYVNQDGVYIPNSLENLAVKRLNEDHMDHFASIGWPTAVHQTNVVSKAYYGALMSLSPKLQAALRMCKEANQIALDRGEFFQWTLPNGDIKRNMSWKPDPTADRVRLSMKDQNGKRVSFSYMPMIRASSGSAVAPTFIHSGDGLTMGDIIIDSYENYAEPIAPIHDSTGATCEHFENIGRMWKEAATRLWLNRPQSMFVESMQRYGIELPKAVWPSGWKPIDISQAQYHLG